jgi:hypothetical protein
LLKSKLPDRYKIIFIINILIILNSKIIR